VFAENAVTLLPIKSETPSSVSPAVTKGNVPEILSSLLSLLPRVDLPKRLF
jgi:hypothetical protein